MPVIAGAERSPVNTPYINSAMAPIASRISA